MVGVVQNKIEVSEIRTTWLGIVAEFDICRLFAWLSTMSGLDSVGQVATFCMFQGLRGRDFLEHSYGGLTGTEPVRII